MTQTKSFPFTQEYLLSCFDFNFETGMVLFKERKYDGIMSIKYIDRWNNRVGSRAFKTIYGKGYLHGKFNQIYYQSHRIIFFAYHNLQPIEIDHIDRNPQNNSINNLQATTHIENNLNRINNGLTPNKNRFYQAKIQHNGKQIHLACCKTAKEAHETMNEYRKEHNLLEPKYLENKS